MPCSPCKLNLGCQVKDALTHSSHCLLRISPALTACNLPTIGSGSPAGNPYQLQLNSSMESCHSLNAHVLLECCMFQLNTPAIHSTVRCLNKCIYAATLCVVLQRYAQTNILKRTIFELIAEELIKTMTDQLAHTPDPSTHGGGHHPDREPQ